MSTMQWNWARNLTYGASRWHFPRTPDEVQEIIRKAAKLKALGTRHSFNGIADTNGEMISCERFERTIDIDTTHHVVTVDGGIRYGELSGALHASGYALPNLASLPHISVAGACATATHGSGESNGNLATSVSGIEFISGNGETVSFDRAGNTDRLCGVVVGLGALGVVTRLTLDIVPSFRIAQTVYLHLPWGELMKHFDEVLSRAYSVSLFLDWKGDHVNQVWVKQRTDGEHSTEPEELFGATQARQDVHPIPGADPVNCTRQMGVPGPWYERLPHFRMEFVPSSGEEFQTEYFVPRGRAVEAMKALREVRERIAPVLHISEVRTIQGDDLWLSPCYRQDSVAFHFTWKKDWAAVQRVLPLIEMQLEPFHCRPHWGKLFAMQRTKIHALFERIPDFQLLVREHDPQRKFQNSFLRQFVLE